MSREKEAKQRELDSELLQKMKLYRTYEAGPEAFIEEHMEPLINQGADINNQLLTSSDTIMHKLLKIGTEKSIDLAAKIMDKYDPDIDLWNDYGYSVDDMLYVAATKPLPEGLEDNMHNRLMNASKNLKKYEASKDADFVASMYPKYEEPDISHKRTHSTSHSVESQSIGSPTPASPVADAKIIVARTGSNIQTTEPSKFVDRLRATVASAPDDTPSPRSSPKKHTTTPTTGSPTKVR